MNYPLALVVALMGCGRTGFDLLSDGGGASSADGDSTGDGGEGNGGDGSVLGEDGAMPDGQPTTLFAATMNTGATMAPTARRSSGAAIDSGNKIWTFGGFAGTGGVLGDLQTYSPQSNSWLAPATSGNAPSARERHTLGWDYANDRLVLFGGVTGTFPLTTNVDQLYIYDPGTTAWTAVTKAGNWPAARKDAAFVWIPSLNQLLLYGGNDGASAASRFSDLWLLSFSGTTATWTMLTPGGVAAPARSSACVAYDPVGQRLVVYGGETQDGADVNTTYQYRLDTNVWQLDTPSGATPPGESFMQCTWDPSVSRVVLYGGQNSSGVPIDGTYTYEPVTQSWATLSPADGSVSPASRSDGGAVYSPMHSGMVWFGGRTASTTYTNETWVLEAR